MLTKSRITRKLAGMFLALVLLGTMIVPAMAYSTSSRTTRTVYGVEYTFYSTIDVSSNNYIDGGVVVAVDQTVDEGYIGAKKRLYTSDGALAKADDWTYNTRSVSTNIGFHFFLTPTSGEYYYSKGQVQLYNGDGYTTYTCTATPNISVNTRSAVAADIAVNQNGEIYGSELFLEQVGIEPDLILAIGENDVVGYVRAADLDGVAATSPDSVAEYMSNVQAEREIPLYAEDGLTVLGTFAVGNSTSWSE